MVRGLGEGMENIQSIADGWLVKLETDGIVNFCKFTNLLTLFRTMEIPLKLHTIKSGWSIVYNAVLRLDHWKLLLSTRYHLSVLMTSQHAPANCPPKYYQMLS